MPIVAFLAVLPLYSILQPQEALDSQTRKDIFLAVSKSPGLTIADIARISGVRPQTARYHLSVLGKGGFVTTRRRGNKVHLFATGIGLPDAHRELLAVGAGSTTMRVLLEVVQAPGASRRSLRQATGLMRTAVAWHVRKLTRLGLVRAESEHGVSRLLPNDEMVRALLEIQGSSAGAGAPGAAHALAPGADA